MARDDDWERIRAACIADRAGCARLSNRTGDLRVCHHASFWNLYELPPDALLKIGRSGELDFVFGQLRFDTPQRMFVKIFRRISRQSHRV
jgi:hypothetical protein